jgi:hypothetical protein
MAASITTLRRHVNGKKAVFQKNWIQIVTTLYRRGAERAVGK